MDDSEPNYAKEVTIWRNKQGIVTGVLK